MQTLSLPFNPKLSVIFAFSLKLKNKWKPYTDHTYPGSFRAPTYHDSHPEILGQTYGIFWPTALTLQTLLNQPPINQPPINQFIKGSSSGLVMNSYLNGNLEDKKCYFCLDSFSTITKFKFRLKVAFYILGMCYTLVLPETQVINYLNIVLKHM